MVKVIIFKPVIKPCIVSPELVYSKQNAEAKPFTLALYMVCNCD